MDSNDGVLSAAAAAAKDASAAFHREKFSECMHVLNQLLQNNGDDPKVLHNIAIARSFQDGCSDPKKLLVLLNNVRAIIWFHFHEHAKAYSILDSLYQKIEQIDEGIALRICLLFLDVALASVDPWKFFDVLNYLEKACSVSNTISQIGSSNFEAKSSSLPSPSSAPDASESPLSRTLLEENLETLISNIDMSGRNLAGLSGLQSSNNRMWAPSDHSVSTCDLRLKLQLYKVQLLLLTRNLKAAKREVKMAMAMNVAHGKDSSMALLLKSQLEYDRGNYPKAIKLLMTSSNQTEIGISSIYNNNMGCIYYRLGKYHTSSIFFSKALINSSSLRKENPKMLSTFSQDKSLEIIYNCGVQYLACGKPILAARCFHKASLIFCRRPLLWLRIAECCLVAVEKGLAKSSSAQSNKSEVKVRVIGNGKWRQLAVENGNFGKGGFVGKDNGFLGDDKEPNLSLPFARQCLFNALYLLNCLESKYTNFASPYSSTSEENRRKNSDNKSSSVSDPKGSHLSNANVDSKEQKGGSAPNATLQSSILNYEEICRRENMMIKQALLADLAYVELHLGNPLKALSTARSLLELPECSRIYIFLGNVYAAESLCLLNRPKEAAQHLLIYLSSGTHVELPYTEVDCEQWRVEKIVDLEESNGGFLNSKNSSLDETQDVVFLKPEEAQGTLLANLAVISAVHGDAEQAHRFVMQALSIMPDSPEAILSSIFVDLTIGKIQEALTKLKQCSRVGFLLGTSH
ncbi:uncharacterized protein LOC131320263 isoform X2 [Rhododendron vialii]|uniref:uncharacterized protein LOC131320263 isoform X2 n=1 Tax=Rhododendron vialii TaxID=182163 RepID=UPI00265E0A39|nr:uncharacterized protein LOC131320263 isoform X2 [Rhododendron vialii]